jgi:RNA polymerase sigma-70 factor (ECF subfamily)
MAATEAGLLDRARRGDETAFLALYESHRTPLFRYTWRLTGSASAAEDVVQECFVALLSRGGYRERDGSVRQYLFGVARHRAWRRLRLSGRESEEADGIEPGDGPLEDLMAAERSEAVACAVGALPVLQREAIVLFEYEGLALEEIAALTGAEVGAVKARLHRARETLRRRLAPLMEPRYRGRCS